MQKLMLLGIAACTALASRQAAAQGCEPIRFTTPINLGGKGQAYQRAHQWEFTLAYRRLHSNDFYVGTVQDPSRVPGGKAPVFDIHTVVADVAYSPADRIRLSLSLPFSTGSFVKKYGDSLYHEQNASGIGDLNAMGELWLLNPRNHRNGNVSVGLGLKAPTGSHTKPEKFYLASGPVDFVADQTIQPGDGGWGISLQAQAFQRVREGIYAYGFGSYLASPKAESDVFLAPTGPTATTHAAVPDVYQARLGAAFAVWPARGLTVSLGGRVDGIPRHDLFGGGDSTTRKTTSLIIYADPGLSLSRGKTSFTLSVPIRLHVNRMKSVLEATTPIPQLKLNGGGFAKFLVLASVSYRP